MFRPVGSVTEYKYSKALSGYNKEWTWEEMNGFLLKPAKWIKETKWVLLVLSQIKIELL